MRKMIGKADHAGRGYQLDQCRFRSELSGISEAITPIAKTMETGMNNTHKPTTEAHKQRNAVRSMAKLLPIAAGVNGSAMATVNDRPRK